MTEKAPDALIGSSFLVEYKFAKRFDAYAGAMYSHVAKGLASGFLNKSTIDPIVGMRFQF